MKGRVILIDPGNGDPNVGELASKAALVVDGRLEDLLIDARHNWQPGPSDIFRAKVTRAGPGGAVFARGLMGADFDFFVRDARDLKPGDEVILQVVAYAEADKAIPASTRMLLKARRLIHSPGAPGVNVSRRIKDAVERQRLSEGLAAFGGAGLIVRFAAAGADIKALVEEATLLVDWGEQIGRGDFGTLTCVLNCSAEFIAQLEWTTPLPDALYLTKDVALDAELEELTVDLDADPFDHFGVWDEIEKLKQPRVDLPSGGWMAVEATRAMVTVDVNTAAEFSAGAAITTNVEAARELPRQLRLRGLGGQVVVDFAPMKKADRKRIEQTLASALARDPVATTVAGWTPLGHLELQRKRERRPLAEVL